MRRLAGAVDRLVLKDVDVAGFKISEGPLPEKNGFKAGYFVLDYDSPSLLFYLTKSDLFLRMYNIV